MKMVATPTYKSTYGARQRPSRMPYYGPSLPQGPTRKPMRTPLPRPRLPVPKQTPGTPAPVIDPPKIPKSPRKARRYQKALGLIPGPYGQAARMAQLLYDYWASPAVGPQGVDPSTWTEAWPGTYEIPRGYRHLDSKCDNQFTREYYGNNAASHPAYVTPAGIEGHEQEMYTDIVYTTPTYYRMYGTFIVPPAPSGWPDPSEWRAPGTYVSPLPFPQPLPNPLPVPAPYPANRPGRKPRAKPSHQPAPQYGRPPQRSVAPGANVGLTYTPGTGVIVDTGKSTHTRPPRGIKESKARNPLVRILAAAVDYGSEITELIENWADEVGIDKDASMQQKLHELFIEGKAWNIDPLDFAWMVMENHMSDQNWGKAFGAAQDAMKDLGQSTYTSPTW